MTESLFTSQTPATQTSEANPGPTLGTVIVVAVAGQVTHGRWWFPNTLPSLAVPFVLYDATTQAELARATFASPTAGAWNTVALPAPVAVTAGQRLVAAIRTADRYAFTSGFFTSSGVTAGNLSAPATGNDPVGNGRFRSNLDAFPSSTFGGNCYFVDVVFEPAGGQSIAPDGISIPVTLGSPTAAAQSTAAPDGISVPVALGSPDLAWSATAAPDGISMPVALGSPTVAWSGSIAPDGISVPVALGAPIVGAVAVAPDGISVPVALGDPALSWSGTTAPDGIGVPVSLGAPTLTLSGIAPDGINIPVILGSPALVWSSTISPDGISVPVALGAPTVGVPSGTTIPARGTASLAATGSSTSIARGGSASIVRRSEVRLR